jgi:hypothetical protein
MNESMPPRVSAWNKSILAKLRLDAGLTIRQLAAKAQLSPTAKWRAEHCIASADSLMAFWDGFLACRRFGDAGEVRAESGDLLLRPLTQIESAR